MSEPRFPHVPVEQSLCAASVVGRVRDPTSSQSYSSQVVKQASKQRNCHNALGQNSSRGQKKHNLPSILYLLIKSITIRRSFKEAKLSTLHRCVRVWEPLFYGGRLPTRQLLWHRFSTLPKKIDSFPFDSTLSVN